MYKKQEKRNPNDYKGDGDIKIRSLKEERSIADFAGN